MDYPRDYATPSWDINIGTAFVIMPINTDFDLPLGLITDVCESLDITAKRADDITKQNFIISNILEGIAKSEIIIVDITGSNANVFYELGIAHTLRPRHSVIIITQDKEISKTTPFDIRHWSILPYSTTNTSMFKSSLKERIKSCRQFVNSEEFICKLLRGYTFDSDIIDGFISTSKQINTSNLELTCNILSGNISVQICDRNKIIELNKYLATLGDYSDGIYLKITRLLKFLTFTSDFVLSQYIDTIKSMFLSNWKRDGIYMDDADHWELIADICCKIIEKKHSDKTDAINWLIQYLHNARMGRIDKVRTKIEHFLLTTKDDEIDNAIVEVLIKPNRTAKESAVDICGQKPIHQSIDNIIKIIKDNNSDPHLIRSSINALARMNVSTAAEDIFNWMRSNRDKWGEKAVSASLMSVAETALKSLNQDVYKELTLLKEE